MAYLVEQFAVLARWVIASLLAVNGGALVTLLGTAHVSIEGKMLAGASFAIGLLAAILTGYANMRSAKRGIPVLTKSHAYWSMVTKGEPRDAEIEAQIESELQTIKRTDITADGLGWFSFAAIIVGLVFAAAHLETPASPESPVQKLEVTVNRD